MGRKHRAWFPGAKYHITSRGNNRAPLFYDNEDRIQVPYPFKRNEKPLPLYTSFLLLNE